MRHHPEDFDLKLAADASVKTDELLQALSKKYKNITKNDLIKLVQNDSKERFRFLDGRKRIRASYGHSIDGVNPDYRAVKPPKILYHGTRPEVKDIILASGLKPMKRNYVHLSVEIQEAEKVALRRTSKPVIFKIKALKAHQEGQNFYKTAANIYLTDKISAKYLSLLKKD
ncbi:RNA 2'-phosphotransferase [Halanaerobium sp. ST460_2HS_T2]|uniref:RNA 2'-phosphotransferase n=1 Tax=Halanaerobium sp. ST460_2HS_T2 TaxID=2183914 RepID=UPI001F16A6CD|nr:RNA 2'-phosphotransferase [Halanaerobium sp. ST460_2HS_T2]